MSCSSTILECGDYTNNDYRTVREAQLKACIEDSDEMKKLNDASKQRLAKMDAEINLLKDEVIDKYNNVDNYLTTDHRFKTSTSNSSITKMSYYIVIVLIVIFLTVAFWISD